LPNDFYQFFALCFGMFSFIMRQVWSSWAGVLMLICSFDYSQLISTGLMIVMSLAANYFMFFRSPFDQPA
jgi:hypothetical protein